jgi:transcriptional regulator with XRE-family HTH domain
MDVIPKIRKALGLNQVKFAELLGKSLGSVRAYEKATSIPLEVSQKLAALAAQQGLADLAMELRGEYEVKRVIEPTETLISTGHKRGGHGDTADASRSEGPGRRTPTTLTKSECDRFHSLLDEVFNSGDPDAIPAVTRNIDVFSKYVRLKRPPKARKSRSV